MVRRGSCRRTEHCSDTCTRGIGCRPPAGSRRIEEVARRIRVSADWQDGPVTCPFLDATHGTCLVYDQRPAACPMYGFYVSRTDHWWCAAIQALYEAGTCDGVILGNQEAIERTLHQQLVTSNHWLNGLHAFSARETSSRQDTEGSSPPHPKDNALLCSGDPHPCFL